MKSGLLKSFTFKNTKEERDAVTEGEKNYLTEASDGEPSLISHSLDFMSRRSKNSTLDTWNRVAVISKFSFGLSDIQKYMVAGL